MSWIFLLQVNLADQVEDEVKVILVHETLTDQAFDRWGDEVLDEDHELACVETRL